VFLLVWFSSFAQRALRVRLLQIRGGADV
jgi:hypothetical protein